MTEKLLFLDENKNVVAEDKATWVVIHTYNNAGKLTNESWVKHEHLASNP
jgi:hypothetical protein